MRYMYMISFRNHPFQDPFNMGVNKGPWGTKAKPTVVPSVFEERLVGCVCECDMCLFVCDMCLIV